MDKYYKKIVSLLRRKGREVIISRSRIDKKVNYFKYYLFGLIEKLIPNYVISYDLLSKNQLVGQKFFLYKNSKSTISPPNFNKKEIFVGNYDSVYALLIDKISFSVFHSTLIKNNSIFLDQLVFEKPMKYGLSKGGFLVRKYNYLDDIALSNNKNFKTLRIINKSIKKRIIIDKAIFICGNGSNNWYHWLIECLPKLFISNNLPKQFSNYPIIAPDICKKNRNFKDALDLFNTQGRDIFYSSNNEIIYAEKLLIIDDIIKAPFNLKVGSRTSTLDYYQNDDLLLKYSDQFQKYYKNNIARISSNIGKKVFLARKSSIRVYNQDQIIEIAKKYKFKIIYCENLDLLSQISLFSNADYIVGPSGAAWSGLIFSSNNRLKCLSWLPDYLNQACNFSNLANLLNHDLKFIKIEDRYNKKKFYNFHCDPYQLNPDLFEKEIKTLISY